MDLLAIKTFCRAVEEGNLTAAAKSLHITKSVASRRIHLLEEELCTKLLVRTTRGVSATDAGAIFYERGIAILADVEDATQSVTDAGKGLTGTIRMTAPRSFADINLKNPLMAFKREYPGLILEMNLTDERVDIVGGGYDLGIRITHKLDDTSLIAKKIAPIQSHLVASPKYLKQHGTPQTLQDLKEHVCPLYSNMPAAHQWSFEKDGKKETVRVNAALMTNSGTMQRESAIRDLTICMLPRFFIHEDMETGALQEVLTDWKLPPAHLYVLFPEKRLLPLKVRVLIDFLADWYKKPENLGCL
ncbi:MAG: LysR substrate-binding domain-containing protein [Kordiimonas sp.]